MAVMSFFPAIHHRNSRHHHPMRSRDVGVSGIVWRRDSVAEDPVSRIIEDMVFVAVGKDVKESVATLRWALHNSGGRQICILHVHQPDPMIPLSDFGMKLPANKVKEQQVDAYRKTEKQNMLKILDDYLLICQRVGVQAKKLHTEMDNIEKGIVELISQHRIKNLVMGAAADRHYSRKMVEIKSKKAIHVRSESPASCLIRFICKGFLIYTRQPTLDQVSGARPLSQSMNPNIETLQSRNLKSRLTTLDLNKHVEPSTPDDAIVRKVRTDCFDSDGVFSSLDNAGQKSPPSRKLDTGGISGECLGISIGSSSHGISSCRFSEIGDRSAQFFGSEGNHNNSELRKQARFDENLHNPSSSCSWDKCIDVEAYEVMSRGEISKQGPSEKSVMWGQAVEDVIEAVNRGPKFESLDTEDVKCREVKQALAKEKEESEGIKKQRNEVMKALQVAMDRKSQLESQFLKSEKTMKELAEKMISAAELLQNYKKELEELQVECDNVLNEAEVLKSYAEVTPHKPQFFSEFSLLEIEEVTHNFNPSLKIGKGGFGSIYRGILHHTEVAIKKHCADSSQGPAEYQQEVDILSKLRHQNLITLIGACPEALALIYEYLPNGSLEDRLNCKDNTAPLPWQTRIRIAAELCCVLIFLHSVKPHGIVHCDVKPANILLDANFVSKLSDFGICRVISGDANSTSNTTEYFRTDPKGTFSYADPEFFMTGELTPKSDVYSFGIILLQLLTGAPPLRISQEVQDALDKGNLCNVLDPSAGDWPFVQARQLAHLALRCCEMHRKNRPDLSEVWRVLEPMLVSSGASFPRHLGSKEHVQIPHHFVCPIFQEVMQDPHTAADGYTYEAEAIRGWLEDDNDTSPMTGLKLAHLNLVPNLALRSAIQEWLQHP